jgi:hypothetical protein
MRFSESDYGWLLRGLDGPVLRLLAAVDRDRAGELGRQILIRRPGLAVLALALAARREGVAWWRSWNEGLGRGWFNRQSVSQAGSSATGGSSGPLSSP